MSKSHIWFILSLVAFGCLVAGCGPIKPPQASTSTLMLASPPRTPSNVPTRTPSITPQLSRTPTTPPTQVNALTTSPTPWPTVIESRHASSPHIVPTSTKDPREAELPAAITLQSAKGVKGHPLRRITGWSQGIATYRWLDNAHLLLYPTIREYNGPVVLPVVMNLNNGRTWMPATEGPDYLFQDFVLWSSSLERLISSKNQEILLYDLQGKITHRFAGTGPLYLSPSGRRLSDRFGWHDLETGRSVRFVGQDKWGVANPAWSSDETRLFGHCWGTEFAIADAASNTYHCLIPGLFRDGEGPFPDFHWVLSDTHVLNELAFYPRHAQPIPVIALIDPTSRSYVNVRSLAGLPASWQCDTSHLAPDTEHLWIDCQDQEFPRSDTTSYLMDLRTFITRTVPAKWEFYSWSSDSHFVVVGRNVSMRTFELDTWHRSNERWLDEYALFSVTSREIYPITPASITAPTWDPQGERLAFLTEDGLTLVVLEVGTRTTTMMPLNHPALDVLWRLQGDGVVMIVDDGSLWQIRDLATGNTEQLTLSVPEISNNLLDVFQIQWSPDGNHLAFISGHDVYVVYADK